MVTAISSLPASHAWTKSAKGICSSRPDHLVDQPPRVLGVLVEVAKAGR
jgi:hypothetical protein